MFHTVTPTRSVWVCLVGYHKEVFSVLFCLLYALTIFPMLFPTLDQCIVFADDTTIYSSSENINDLQHSVKNDMDAFCVIINIL